MSIREETERYRGRLNGVCCPPGLSGLCLQLVDPGLVDVHRVGVDAQALVLDDLPHHGGQQLPQGILAASATVETHHHLNDCGVPRHNVLNLVHFRPEEEYRSNQHS